jgi:hypothetical protein
MQWLVERGIEIISEASRHLPAEMKPAIRACLGGATAIRDAFIGFQRQLYLPEIKP